MTLKKLQRNLPETQVKPGNGGITHKHSKGVHNTSTSVDRIEENG
jgi:hypothetical protein